MTDNEIKLMELDKTVRENEIVRQINEKRRIDLEQQRITEFDKIVDDSINEIAERVIGDPAIVDRIDNEIANISVLAKSAVVFDTVEEMKQSDKLKAGMTARTNGFHKAGDGGAAWYRIESSGIHNDMDVILCSNKLFAKLMIVDSYVSAYNGTANFPTNCYYNMAVDTATHKLYVCFGSNWYDAAGNLWDRA